MSRLTFLELFEGGEQTLQNTYYQIFNDKKQFLGQLMLKRVGAWMTWVFCPDLDDDMAPGDIWFSNGCLKQIVKFIEGLYSSEIKERKKNADAKN